MKIHISNRQKDMPLSAPAVRASVRAVLAHQKIPCEEISLFFVSSREIARLHQEFFQDPSPTDCISFPIEKGGTLGDIFVCPKIALDYAAKKGLDPAQETLLYIVHGILHLAGHDDIDPVRRRAMRKKEKSCMDHLNTLGLSIR